MRTSCAMAVGCVAAVLLAGCRGEYRLTMPDQVAAKGREASAVLRLERNEFAGLMLPAKGVPVSMRVQDEPLVAAYTDPKGYASANVPVGNRLGKYFIQVHLQDSRGHEVEQHVPVYVWDPAMTVVAVELDAVKKDGLAAREALNKIASNAYILYFTSDPIIKHGLVHSEISSMNLPEGVVVSWKQEAWHVASEKNMPRLVLEDRLVSPLASLRAQFRQLKVGVCTSDLAAKAFFDAGMKIIVIGSEKVTPASAVRKTWAEIAKGGL